MKGFIEVHLINEDKKKFAGRMLFPVHRIVEVRERETGTLILSNDGMICVSEPFDEVTRLIQEATEIRNKYVIDFSDLDISQQVRHDLETYGKIKEDTFKEILKRSHEKQDRERRKNG